MNYTILILNYFSDYKTKFLDSACIIICFIYDINIHNIIGLSHNKINYKTLLLLVVLKK